MWFPKTLFRAMELTVAASPGADPNRVTAAGGATSLHRAAYMGHDAVVRLLCALDCSPGLAFKEKRVLVCCAPSWANRQSASHLRRAVLPDGRGSCTCYALILRCSCL